MPVRVLRPLASPASPSHRRLVCKNHSMPVRVLRLKRFRFCSILAVFRKNHSMPVRVLRHKTSVSLLDTHRRKSKNHSMPVRVLRRFPSFFVERFD